MLLGSICVLTGNVMFGPGRGSINCIPPFLGSCFMIITFLSDSSHLVLPNERILSFPVTDY